MRWPSGHPALTDGALAVWAPGADEVCAEGVVVDVLRHVPGRRVTSLMETPAGPAVLKIFANPRARGNHRRLLALASSPAADSVPRTLAADRTGHVGLVEFVPGSTLTAADPGRLPGACFEAGRRVARLHNSGVVLDRTWRVDDELGQLRQTWGPATRASLGDLVDRWRRPTEEVVVSAHRDCHPGQAVTTPDGSVRWIDLDDAAMAPPGLDVGNFLAHLTREGVLGRRSAEEVAAARDAFLAGYGRPPAELSQWELLSLARLAGLAETRHRAMTEAATLITMVSDRATHGSQGARYSG